MPSPWGRQRRVPAAEPELPAAALVAVQQVQVRLQVVEAHRRRSCRCTVEEVASVAVEGGPAGDNAPASLPPLQATLLSAGKGY